MDGLKVRANSTTKNCGEDSGPRVGRRLTWVQGSTAESSVRHWVTAGAEGTRDDDNQKAEDWVRLYGDPLLDAGGGRCGSDCVAPVMEYGL